MQVHTSSLTDIGQGGCEAFLFQEARNQGKTVQGQPQPNRYTVRTGGYGLGEKVLLAPAKAPAVGKPMSVAIRSAVASMGGWFHCTANDPARQVRAGVLNLGNNGTQAGSHVLSLSLHKSCHLTRFAFYRSAVGLRLSSSTKDYANSICGLSNVLRVE